jgi:hypothetical protein
MRPTDEDDPQPGSADDSLADGLDETTEGGFSSSSDPYGDTDDDDDYGDDGYVEDDDDGYDEDDSYDDGGDDGDTYGDGDSTTFPGDDEDDDTIDVDSDDDGGLDPGVPPEGELDPVAHDASPLEGIGFLLDEIGDALFGEDDDDASVQLFDDPADATTDTDLDLTGDGVVDRADLHEARSLLDFKVAEGDHHPHDGGLFDG